MIRDEWLRPTATAPDCGPDLDSTEEFVALVDAARPRPEKRDGQNIRPAQDPDWSDVVKRASNLLVLSHDLRIVHLLARGLTHTEGVAGLRDGLRVACTLLETYWDSMHPQLVFEGEPDPILRINAMAAFADLEGLVRDTRFAVFMRSPLGTITVRDVERTLSAANASGSQGITASQLRSAILDQVKADAGALGEAVECIDTIDRLRAVFIEHVGESRAPDLGLLRKTLGAVADLVREARVAAAAALAPSPPGTAPSPSRSDAAPSTGAIGDIRTREDAITALARVCAFLSASEPTNPAPLLIRRAQRLMVMPFLDIIRELAPDAMGRVETVIGTEPAPDARAPTQDSSRTQPAG